MNTKSIGLLLFFILVHYIAYNYIKNKHNSNDNINIQYIIPPITYEDYFTFKDLNKFYGTLFSKDGEELNIINSRS
jgi:hypothetical protein